jgi:hypothetical protein
LAHGRTSARAIAPRATPERLDALTSLRSFAAALIVLIIRDPVEYRRIAEAGLAKRGGPRRAPTGGTPLRLAGRSRCNQPDSV